MSTYFPLPITPRLTRLSVSIGIWLKYQKEDINRKTSCQQLKYLPHLAGNANFREKNVQRVLSIQANLLIKISYNPDFENVYSRDSKVMTKKIVSFESFFLLAIPLLAMIIGVWEVNFFSKIEFNRFFKTSKYAQIYFFYKIGMQCQKISKNQFKRKSSLNRPLLFLQVLGGRLL